MSPRCLSQLSQRAAAIRDRWERLIRLEPVRTPLANAEAMVYLIPASIQSVLALLRRPRDPSVTLANARIAHLPNCACELNPYLTYFVAGEQAFTEEMVLLAHGLPAGQRDEHDTADLVRAVNMLGQCEIETFCSVCTRAADGCSYRAKSGSRWPAGLADGSS